MLVFNLKYALWIHATNRESQGPQSLGPFLPLQSDRVPPERSSPWNHGTTTDETETCFVLKLCTKDVLKPAPPLKPVLKLRKVTKACFDVFDKMFKTSQWRPRKHRIPESKIAIGIFSSKSDNLYQFVSICIPICNCFLRFPTHAPLLVASTALLASALLAWALLASEVAGLVLVVSVAFLVGFCLATIVAAWLRAPLLLGGEASKLASSVRFSPETEPLWRRLKERKQKKTSLKNDSEWF